MNSKARSVLVSLLASWPDWPEARSWYLAEFVPKLVATGVDAARNSAERRQIEVLRSLLPDEEWEALGLLLVKVEPSAESLRVALQENANRQRALEAQTERRRRVARNREQRTAEEDERWRRRHERDRERAEALALAREAADTAAQARARAREQLLRGLEDELESRFLGARDWLRENDPESLVDEHDFAAAAAYYVTRWCTTNARNVGGKPFQPDPQQAAAIASVDRHALVAARAGSGKTATMVTRAAFLVRACGADPAEILMLAFNVAAAEEMRERLEKLLPGKRAPHVMTFHALAHRLVHPEENLLYDVSDAMRPLSHHIQGVVNDLIREPPQQFRIREVMLAYFKKDWSKILERGDNLSPTEQVEFRRHLQHESVKGDFVKSFGEKLIANVLFEHGLDYGYEHDVRWKDTNYKPDFSVYDGNKKRRVVIEYFGLAGDPDYDKRSDDKRAYWAGIDDVRFFEYGPADVAAPEFEAKLLADLAAAGAPLRRLTDEEIWERIKTRAIDRFTETVTTLIGRARQRRWSAEDVRTEWSRYGVEDEDLDRFVELGADLLDAYAASLAAARREDFTGLLWRAVDAVRSGTTSFGRQGRVEGDLRQSSVHRRRRVPGLLAHVLPAAATGARHGT